MLKNKTIVVTGGAGLLGTALSEKLLESEANVVIAESNTQRAEELLGKLISERLVIKEVDITDKKSISELINETHAKYGNIDAVVNCAYPRNKNFGKHFFEVQYDDFCDNVGMNLGGYFLVSQQFAKYFKSNGGGNIINMASIYGVVAPRFDIYKGTNMTVAVEYAAIKSGLIQLTKYMANYLKGCNIRINTVSLGGLLDNQPESFLEEYKKHCLNKGMLEPKDVVGTILFLLSGLSTYVNGQNLVVDDGFVL